MKTTGLLAASLLAIGMAGIHPAPVWAGAEASAGSGAVEEPAGYRMADYRAPVPATLNGARVATTAEVEKLWHSGEAALLDVMGRPQKPADLPAGTIWRDPVRKDIPRSLWLANVGYGALTPETTAYFRQALEEISQGAKDRPLVFYCMADCWLSWNAARRAVEWGYSAVLWYPDGADGWEKAGLPLAENQPHALERE